ncbi:uncharacterized protein BYT42DRAFT_498392 [Radiomyces spectabilis]|uniref:uncharacterized protein n=1 Tax=Radiomyces spectabilis TaxID=64574 RepID=UPI00221FBDC6|nr:uncharacterized protein BYT42DRAFT_498392 [Radiomyces spectabilis]KAI8376121.1 hypothetical protein BYT42DRAFT_498392 [Radiomyces spectabilis]
MFTKNRRYLAKRHLVSKHYQNIPVKSWRNVSVSKGNYALLVDDTWFSRPLKPGSAPVVHDCLLYMVASGINPEKEMNNLYSDFPSPVHINIARKWIILYGSKCFLS